MGWIQDEFCAFKCNPAETFSKLRRHNSSSAEHKAGLNLSFLHHPSYIYFCFQASCTGVLLLYTCSIIYIQFYNSGTVSDWFCSGFAVKPHETLCNSLENFAFWWGLNKQNFRQSPASGAASDSQTFFFNLLNAYRHTTRMCVHVCCTRIPTVEVIYYIWSLLSFLPNSANAIQLSPGFVGTCWLLHT